MGGLFGGGNTIATTDTQLSGIDVQSSSYGVPLTLFYGTHRLTGNLFYYTDFTPIAHTTSQRAGKGGGGSTMTQTTYTYLCTALLGLGEGPANGITKVWADKLVFKDTLIDNGDGTVSTNTALSQISASLFPGALGQAPFSLVTSNHPTEALGYSGLAYVGFSSMDLGNTGHMMNYAFEVAGACRFVAPGGVVMPDANPSDVITDLFTHPMHGAGVPVAVMGDMTLFSSFCVAAGLFLSPTIDTSRTAMDWANDIFTATNCAPFQSGGTIKIVPYADQALTGNGTTYSPVLAPWYDLTDDDFLRDGDEDPILVTRSTPADAWNQVHVEFRDRAQDYNIAIAEAKDSANIDAYGLRTNDPIQLHFITTYAVAQQVAQAILQRKLYIRNTYQFRLGWKYCRLEPMDAVTLTDTLLGLSQYRVRITDVEENEFGDLTITAEDWPLGQAIPAVYATQQASGTIGNFNVSPGNANAPVILEPYFQQTGGKLELWIAASGAALWGSADVYLSLDGNSYSLQGTISAPARQGTLLAGTGAASSGLDIATTVQVDTSQSRAQVLSGSDADLAAYSTLCYLDGEFFAYRDSTLIGPYQYALSRLQRGVFGSPTVAHLAGKQFLRVDPGTVFKFGIRDDQVGKQIFIKLISRNVFGGGGQALGDVDPTIYAIQGTALKAAPADTTNLTTGYLSNQAVLQWDPVTDYRSVVYEVRKGPSFATAQIIGTTPATRFPCNGSGTYWVAVKCSSAYSLNPPSLVVTGQLVQNVVQTWDEQGTSWAGTMGGGAYNNAGAVQLGSAGLISTISLISGVTSFLALGSVASSGTYTVPGSHEVDVLNVQACNVTASFTAQTVNPYSTIGSQTSIAAMASIIGSVANKTNVVLQIAVSDQSGTYGAWQNFIPGTFSGRKFKMQALLSSSDAQLTPSLSSFTWTVDVPDRAERGTNAAILAGGSAVSFTKSFQAVPNVQVTILNAVAGDDVFFTAGPSTNGFTVQVKNAGTGVARNINWFAQGY